MLMAVVAVFAFTACGDDDSGKDGNGGNGSQVTPEQLIGTWYGVDENSSKKINIFVMAFASGGSGNLQSTKPRQTRTGMHVHLSLPA